MQLNMPFTQNDLRSLLDYDPETGAFLWKRRKGNRYGGKQAGTLRRDGYIAIRCFGKTWQAHWLAWFYVHAVMPKEIDHANLNKADNRISNLRLCTRAQNHQNTPISKRNTSGIKGVRWAENQYGYGMWRATIKVASKHFHKCFRTKEEAASWYQQMATKHFREFARVI
jgi:hypothetical protein